MRKSRVRDDSRWTWPGAPAFNRRPNANPWGEIRMSAVTRGRGTASLLLRPLVWAVRTRPGGIKSDKGRLLCYLKLVISEAIHSIGFSCGRHICGPVGRVFQTPDGLVGPGAGFETDVRAQARAFGRPQEVRHPAKEVCFRARRHTRLHFVPHRTAQGGDGFDALELVAGSLPAGPRDSHDWQEEFAEQLLHRRFEQPSRLFQMPRRLRVRGQRIRFHRCA